MKSVPSQKRRGRRGSLVHRIALLVSGAVLGLTAGASTDASAARTVAPSNTSPPTITGEPVVGQTLSASSGSWSGDTPMNFAYQWRRCAGSGASCADIAGASGQTYAITNGDVGNTLRVQVTATNADGSAQALSAPTASVAEAEAPANTSKPTISGTAREGERLTVSNGSWSGTTPMTFSYRWERCSASGSDCAAISGATSQSYTIVNDDVGRRLLATVTAENTDGSSNASTDATAVVTARANAPANTSKPRIAGTPREGERLTVSNGSWSGTTPMTFSYSWTRCTAGVSSCTPIPGATSQTYTVTRTDVGSRLAATVTARNAAGSSSASTDATAVVTARTAAPVNTALPAISGAPEVGKTLSASNGSWNNSPTSFSYQWQGCNTSGAACANISGANARTYGVTNADSGRRLRVVVSARNASGSASAASQPTAAVGSALPAGAIRLPNGQTSIPASSVTLPERLIVDRVSFSPNVVRSRNQTIRATFRVVDTRGFVVRDALVFLRSTPIVTNTPGEARTGQDGTVTIAVAPERDFPLRRGYSVQFFVRARKQGDKLLAGVSTRRLVQVRTVPAR